jgi:purine-cytosine permease-like protein
MQSRTVAIFNIIACMGGSAVNAIVGAQLLNGLLAAVLIPPFGRFGEFCLVVLALSMVANNCPNMYSLTFSLQVLGRWTQAVPRFIWSIIGTFVYCAIAIPGYSKFEVVLQKFMSLIVRQSDRIPFKTHPH